MEDFGIYLKYLRTLKNLSVTKLANMAGISPSYISQIENGKRAKPNPKVLIKLSKPLGVTHYELLVKCGYLDSYDPIILDLNDETITQIIVSMTEAKKQLLIFLDDYDEEAIHGLVSTLNLFAKKK